MIRYALHALVNMVVVTNALPDLMRTFADPINSMQGRCSVVPPTLIASLFMYHLGTFKNVAADEWYHHIIFGGGIATWGIYYCPGPLQVQAVPSCTMWYLIWHLTPIPNSLA
jgi:hypothetical protein